MAILHTVNQSPFNRSTLSQCLERLSAEDSLLLLEDGVYGALSAQPYAQQMQAAKQCYAIADDIHARGIHIDDLITGIELIDYDKFVQLTINNTLVQSWY